MIKWIKNRIIINISYISVLIILFTLTLYLILSKSPNNLISEVYLTVSSILLVIITIICNHINRKRDAFSQLFNTQISLFNHYFNTNTILKTVTIDNKNDIQLVTSDKIFKVIESCPITKNFCEYYKANIKEVGYRELSSSEIIKIWNVFCKSLLYRSEFEYSFKNIFMCIRTVKNEKYLNEIEKKEYVTKINDLLNSEQLFCYFVNQVHFCSGDFSKDANVKLLKENYFFNDLIISELYQDIKHSIPHHLKLDLLEL